MYNQDIKERFLDYAKDHKKADRQKLLFEQLAPYEEKLNKDLGEMSKQELIGAFQFLGGSYSTMNGRLPFVRRYLKWYSEFVCPVPYHVSNLTWKDIDLTEQFKQEHIRGLSQIVTDWQEYPPESGDYIQPYFVFAWYGLAPKQFLAIKSSDIIDQGDKFVVRVGDTETVIDDEVAVSILRDYAHYTNDSSGNHNWYRPDTDLFFYKKISDTSPKVKTTITSLDISSRIGWLKQNGYKRLARMYDYTSIRNAGLYNRVIALEDSGADEDEIGELIKAYGMTSQSKVQQEIQKASIDTYRKAFKL